MLGTSPAFFALSRLGCGPLQASVVVLVAVVTLCLSLERLLPRRGLGERPVGALGVKLADNLLSSFSNVVVPIMWLVPFASSHALRWRGALYENGDFGNITTLWDQLFGTWLEPRPCAPQLTGAWSLVDDHPDTDLIGQLVSPLGRCWRRVRRRAGSGVVGGGGASAGGFGRADLEVDPSQGRSRARVGRGSGVAV